MSYLALLALRRERMSTVDTAWLRMDSGSNLMMIVSVQLFSAPMDPVRFRNTIETRLLRYSRFRSKVVRDITGSAWWKSKRSTWTTIWSMPG